MFFPPAAASDNGDEEPVSPPIARAAVCRIRRVAAPARKMSKGPPHTGVRVDEGDLVSAEPVALNLVGSRPLRSGHVGKGSRKQRNNMQTHLPLP